MKKRFGARIRGINLELIKERRSKKGLTQKDVAEKIGMGLSNYKVLELGRKIPDESTIEALSSILDLSKNEIMQRDTKVITFALHKGGCGKTTMCSGFIQSLVNKGFRILAVDADPQMHLNKSFNLSINQEKNLYNIFSKQDSKLEDNIILTQQENLDFVLGHHELTMVDSIMATLYNRESIFRTKLAPIIDRGIYDFVIIDTNPTLNVYNFNFLTSSDKIIIPVEASPFGVEGISTFMKYYKQVKYANPSVEIAGIVFTRVDSRESISEIMMRMVKETFEDVRIFDTVIPKDTNVQKAQGISTTIVDYDPKSKASVAIDEFTQEVLEIV